MADSFTPGYDFILPEVGGSLDTWGTKLNQNIDELDTLLRMFVGMVAKFPSTDSALPGWLKCNGQEVSRTTFARLWDWAELHGQVEAAEPQTNPGMFGHGDGSTTFRVPDLRGYVLRAFDDGAGVDASRVFGSIQADQNKSHDHGGGGSTSAAGGHDHGGATGSAGSHNHGGSTGSAGGHSHSGSIGSAGAHTHTFRFRDAAGTNSGTLLSAEGTALGTGSDSTPSSTNDSVLSAGSHSHSLSINSVGSHTHSISTQASHTHTISSVGDHSHTLNLTSDGGAETRVKNIALSAYIKT